jgi:hypothetical protein
MSHWFQQVIANGGKWSLLPEAQVAQTALRHMLASSLVTDYVAYRPTFIMLQGTRLADYCFPAKSSSSASAS